MQRVIAFALSCLVFTSAVATNALVLGSTRNTGLEVVRLLEQQGVEVTGMARPTSDIEALQATGASIEVGDAMDPASLEEIFARNEFTVVISTLGSKFKTNPKPDFLGNKHAIDAAKAHGVKHFVMVTMIGVGATNGALEPRFRKLFTEQIALKSQAEEYLKSSGLPYTIYRPGGLYSGPATGIGLLTQDPTVMGVVSRSELAQIIVTGLADDSRRSQTYSVVDPKRQRPDWDGKSEQEGIPKEL